MEENPYIKRELVRKVAEHIVGRRREILAIIAALAAGKNVLLEGPPGTTKSTILRTIARESEVPFYMIEGSADLTPQKLIGIFNPVHVLKKGYKAEYFEPGPLLKAMKEGGILYIEEFNRMPEDAANVLIRAMEEREIVVPRLGIIKAKPSFRVIAGMNPYDDIGTSRVSRAIMDRFCKLRLDYQSREEEIEIVKMKTKCEKKWLIELAVDLTRATRTHPAVKMGASVRGAIDMVLIVEQLQKLKEDGLKFEDIYDAAVLALSSKIWMRDPNMTPEDVIKELLESILGGRKLHDPPKRSEKIPQKGCKEEESKDEVEYLLFLSKVSPLRASLLLENSLLDLLEQAISTGFNEIKVLELYSRIHPYIKKDQKYLAKKYARELIFKITSKSIHKYMSDRIIVDDFNWDSDDIELDRTIEEIVYRGTIDVQSLKVYKRDVRDRLYALIIDRSSSMTGFKIAIAAIVATTLIYATPWSKYSVAAFNTEVEFIKRALEYVPKEIVIDRILSLVPEGYTDIARAISKVHKHLVESGAFETIGILITDGQWTWGESPLKYAPMFTKLHVIGVPSKWRGFAETIAIYGHGKFILVRDTEAILSKLPLLLE